MGWEMLAPSIPTFVHTSPTEALGFFMATGRYPLIICRRAVHRGSQERGGKD